MIKKRLLLLLPLAVMAGACSDTLVQPSVPEASLALVGSNIAGEAELQAALDAAAAASNGTSTIRLKAGATITLSATLTHDGAKPVRIDGRGATIVGPASGSAFAFTGGANLTIDGLTVKNAAEHGIYVEVPGDRSGTQAVVLSDVVVKDNGFGGLWVDDQVHDSPASLNVRVLRSEFSGNNTAGLGEELDYDEIIAAADKDAIRVNEGGDGDLSFFIQDSYIHHNQADGVELDETGAGDVVSQALNSHFDDNGDQLVFPVTPPAGAPADYEQDLEDGFDIDENDDGSVYAQFENVTAIGNEDEGIDLDETYDGSIHMSGNNIVANDNFGAGIQLTESEEEEGTEGDIVLQLTNVTANDSRDSRGIRVEEFWGGDVLGFIVNGTFDGNDSDGFRIEELEDDGDIDFRFENSAFTNNGGRGLRATDSGTIVLVNPVFGGNGSADYQADGTVSIQIQGT